MPNRNHWKIKTGIRHLPQLRKLGNAARWLYVCLVDLAVESDNGGALVRGDGMPFTIDDLVIESGLSKSYVIKSIAKLIESGLLSRFISELFVTNYKNSSLMNRRQFTNRPYLRVCGYRKHLVNSNACEEEVKDYESFSEKSDKYLGDRGGVSANVLCIKNKKEELTNEMSKPFELTPPDDVSDQKKNKDGWAIQYRTLIEQVYQYRNQVVDGRIKFEKKTGALTKDAVKLADRLRELQEHGTESFDIVWQGPLNNTQCIELFVSMIDACKKVHPDHMHPVNIWGRNETFPKHVMWALQEMKRAKATQAGLAKNKQPGEGDADL